MSDRIISTSTTNTPERAEHPHVLGKFSIKNHHYAIVLLEGSEVSRSGNSTISGVPALPASDFSGISHFELNGQLFAVLEVQPTVVDEDIASLLTDRELQIATLVASGKPNKQIARQLHISEWTVAAYLRRVFVKLGVDSRAAMVYRCASMIQQSHHLGVG